MTSQADFKLSRHPLGRLVLTDAEGIAKCALLDIAADKLGLDAGTLGGDLKQLKARAVAYLQSRGWLVVPDAGAVAP